MKNKTKTIIIIMSMAIISITGCKKEIIIPGAREISGDITSDSIWQHTANATVDYIVSGTVHILAKLTIRPGTIVQLKENGVLEVGSGGSLNATGTSSERITITSVPGVKWGSIVFYTQSDTNKLHYCDILNGGKGSIIIPAAEVVVGQNTFAEGKVSIRDCVFEASAGSGLFINDQSEVINFANNAFNNNTDFPITLTSENLNDLNSNTAFSANGKNYVEIRDCVHPVGEGQTIKKLAIGYYLQEQVILHGNDTIQPGVELVHTGNGFLVAEDFGNYVTTLTIAGTTANPVVLKGENTNSWKGIITRCSGSVNISNAQIKNGGASPNAYGQQASVIVENGSAAVSIRDCVFDASGGYGIDLGGGQNHNSDIATVNSFVNCTLGNINY